MRLLLAPALLLVTGCTGPDDRAHRQIMLQIEESVQLPPGAKQLKDYARYYAKDGNRVVARYITLVDPANGYYDLPLGQARWVEDHRNLPAISDGGCSVVKVRYDPAAQRVEQADCNGQA
jgi:hypothetical protein